MGEEVKKTTLEKLGDYIRGNIRNNIKKISATFGQVAITVVGLSLYGIKAGLDWTTILMTLVFAMQPFFNIWVNIIFKGEAEVQEREIIMLSRELEFARELSEYKIQAVAFKAVKNWNDANDLIEEVKKINEENKT